MIRRRSISRGGTDYTGVPLEDIYEHLGEWRESTAELLRNLRNHRIEVIQNEDKIDRVQAIIRFIDYSIDLFNRFLLDFDRIIKELPNEVTEAHIEIIEQIFRRSELHEQYCIQFTQDHIEKSLRDESMRPLLDNIYADTRDEIVNYTDLSNVIPRLRTYIGTIMNKKSNLSSDALDVIEIKPNIFGIGLNLNAFIKKIQRLFAANENSVRIFHENGAISEEC